MPTVDSETGGRARGVARPAAGPGLRSFRRHVAALNSEYRLARQAGDLGRFSVTRTRAGNHELLNRLGVRNARVLHTTTSADLDQSMLDGPVVIKPADGASGIGVVVLNPPDTDGTWLDVRGNRRHTIDTLKAMMSRVLGQYPHWRDLWLVEERIRPTVGDVVTEYQCFTFGGRVATVKAYRSYRARTSRLFLDVDEGWTAIDTGMWSGQTDPSLPAPDDPDAVLALASRVALACPFAFVRVDVWQIGGSELAVGEVNDHDGNPTFNAGWDRYLGLLWDLAEQSTLDTPLVRVSEPALPSRIPGARLIGEPAPAAPRRKRQSPKRGPQ